MGGSGLSGEHSGEVAVLSEVTTSAGIATTPSPFILTRQAQWPFGASPLPVKTDSVRKKSRKKRKTFSGPYINILELSVSGQ